MKPADLLAFQQLVRTYFKEHGRHDLPWRQPEAGGFFDPYKITVSELMLQQTQVGRVIPKYTAFVERFPTVARLSDAPLGEVLQAWSGLGYNRRAKFLWQTAHIVAEEYRGEFPATGSDLMTLPGIGSNTAGAILAYAFNQPEVFIETNVRTVFIHHFFAGRTKVTDAALLPLVAQAVPPADPRQWYWALMDYGSHLKRAVGNLSRASTHYTKQSAFEGSRRQIRGQILRYLTRGAYPAEALTTLIADARLPSVLADLQSEGLIENINNTYRLRML